MPAFASGAAFIDPSGAVVAADAGFLDHMGLSPGDPTAALRARAETSPELRALLASDGPGMARVGGADGQAVEVDRVPAGSGALLVARPAGSDEWMEHVMRSQALTRLAAGLSHDIKNPLNAMALQIALLTEKLAATADASATSASHLSALRDQIGRVNEVVRRFLDVTDPSSPLGYTDVGALVADTASLFGHDARRRRVELTVEASAGAVRTRCDAGRVSRLVLGLFSRAMAEIREGGRLSARAEASGPDVLVIVEHQTGAHDGGVGYYLPVAAAGAAALGGSVTAERTEAVERVTLRLPRNERA